MRTPDAPRRFAVHGHPVPRRFPDPTGRVNVAAAWWMMTAGLLLGAIIGLWSFDGPFPAPPGFGAYDSLPRRLVRLAHIAMIALPVINLAFVPSLRQSPLSPARKRTMCRFLLTGSIALPAVLLATAIAPTAKYLLPIPVMSIFVPIAALALSLSKKPSEVLP